MPGESKIRFGMAAVKGVGGGAVEEILRARKDSKFISVEDFAKRVSSSKFNKKAWDSLIKSGGFDQFGDRADLLFNLETIQAFASKVQKEAASGQTDLFGGLPGMAALQPTITMQTSPTQYTSKERLAWERELLGLYISAHPLDEYDAYFAEQTIPLMQMKPDVDGKKMTIGGIVNTVRTIVTKSGSKMAFVAIEDKTGESEIIVFPKLFEQVGAKLQQDAVIRASGKASARDRDGNLGTEAKLIADELVLVSDGELQGYESTGRKMTVPAGRAPVSAYRKQAPKPAAASAPSQPRPPVSAPVIKKLFVHIKNPDNHEALLALKQTCSRFPGVSDVVLVLGSEKASAIKLPFRVDGDGELLGELVKLFGEDCVTLK